MQAHQLIAGFIASFNLKTFNLNIFGMKLKIFSIFWADDIWKNSAPHKINYKQLAIVCLMILLRRKIEEKFFRIKLKLIEWMKTEKIYCLFRDLHGIGVEIAARNVSNALVGMQVAISISIPMPTKKAPNSANFLKARGGDSRPFYTEIHKSITFTVGIVAVARKYSIFWSFRRIDVNGEASTASVFTDSVSNALLELLHNFWVQIPTDVNSTDMLSASSVSDRFARRAAVWGVTVERKIALIRFPTDALQPIVDTSKPTEERSIGEMMLLQGVEVIN